MKTQNQKSKPLFFEKFARTITKFSGSSSAIIIAFLIVLAWLITGPAANFSEQWQLIINTGTTIITFLMVFLIQKSQNKDALAIQLKLNELIAASDLASNRLVDIESMTEEELKVIQKYYKQLSGLTKNEETLHQSHSIDEVPINHNMKKEFEKNLLKKFKNNSSL